MIRTKTARLVAGVVAALMGVMLIGVGGASAGQPGWKITASATLPAVVSPGAVAGYSFTITNTGTSNISQLYLTADFPAVYFQTPTDQTGADHPCLVLQLSPTLFCSLGALNANFDSFSFVVAFTAPTSGTSFNPGLGFNTTGATSSDGAKQTSHGDTLLVGLTTQINSSPDFAGTFTPDSNPPVATNPILGKKNIQATSVNPPSAHIPVTLDDSGTVTFDCGTSTACTHAFGVWSALNVNNGANYSGTAFQVTLLVLGQAVPGGVTASDIEVLHVLTTGPNAGTTELLTQTGNACPTPDPSVTTSDCIASVTKVGNNFQVVLWLIQNGGARGTY